MVDPLRAAALAGVPHGFGTRAGGVSVGVLAGLNAGLGAGDDPDAVAENRRRLAAAILPDAALLTPYQTHSAIVHTVAEPWPADARPDGDALVTDRPGLLIGIVTADCAPVLLADRAAGVVGAAHAGWKGAAAGVLEATVAAMAARGAVRSRIAAAIGPTIAQPSYEVDAAFRDRFCAADAGTAPLFVAGAPGHCLFDLPGYVALLLGRAGVGTIADLACDTYAAPDRFYSYRRATHAGQPAYGRQLSAIGLGAGR